ncbi:MAG: tetratricopeptide repeat protein [Candidatus Omnitrophota bacterium]
MKLPASVLALFLAVLGLFFYAPVLQYPFVHDDVAFIRLNPDIGRWDNIADAFLHPGVDLGSGRVPTPYYRPVLEVLNRAQYALFGFDAAGFHFFNVLVHVLNACLLMAVLTAAFACPAGWAFFLAAVFLLHPVQTQAVACVSGLSNLASAFFLLVSFLSYWRTRTPGSGIFWLFLSGGSFVAALFTKESAVMLPLVIVLYESLVGSGSRRRVPVIGLALLAGSFLVWRHALLPGLAGQIFDLPGEWRLRLLSIPSALINDARLIVWPVDLHYLRQIDVLAPQISPALFLTSGALLITAALIRASDVVRRHALFGLGWFLLFLLPHLNIAPMINEYSFVQAAEHFLYLPLFGILLVTAAFLPGLLRGVSSRIMIMAGAGLILACGILTAGQLPFWRSEVVLFERAVLFEPRAGRVRLLLARAYADAGRYDEAWREYAVSLQIMTEYVKKAGHSQGAVAVYRQFIKTIYFDRGQLLLRKGDPVGANREFLLSLRTVAPSVAGFNARAQDCRTFSFLAMNRVRAGDMTVAARYFKLALAANAADVEALNNMGMVYLQRKNDDMARFFFERALKVHPGFGPAWENLKRLDIKR